MELTQKKQAYTFVKVELTLKEKRFLKELVSIGNHPSRVITRGRILLLLDRCKSRVEIADFLEVDKHLVTRIGKKYVSEGMERALYEKQRPQNAIRAFSEKESQSIVAMLCSSPPAGKARWSVRIAAEEAVKRGIVKAAARDTIRRLIKKHDV